MLQRCFSQLKSSVAQSMVLVFFVLLLGIWQMFFCRVALSASDNNVSLDLLLDGALKGNQELISAAAQSQQYNIRIPLVDNLSDPFLAFYYLDFPIGNISSGWTERENEEKVAPPAKVNIQSRRGKILTGRDMVENQALWYDYLSADRIIQVTGQVRENFYQLYFLDKIISVTEKSLQTLDNLIEANSINYQVGKVRQKDVLRTHTERYQLQADLIRLQQQRYATENQLNYLSARPTGKPLIPQIDGELTHENLPEMTHSARDFTAGLYQKRPLLKGYQALGGRFKAMRGMVQMYFNREVQTEAMFEADSGYRAIKARGADFYSRTVSDIRTAFANLKKNKELSGLYGQVIVPQRRQFFDSVLEDYKVGREDYQTLLNALLDLNKDQNFYYQTLADYMVDMARLEQLSGLSIN